MILSWATVPENCSVKAQYVLMLARKSLQIIVKDSFPFQHLFAYRINYLFTCVIHVLAQVCVGVALRLWLPLEKGLCLTLASFLSVSLVKTKLGRPASWDSLFPQLLGFLFEPQSQEVTVTMSDLLCSNRLTTSKHSWIFWCRSKGQIGIWIGAPYQGWFPWDAGFKSLSFLMLTSVTLSSKGPFLPNCPPEEGANIHASEEEPCSLCYVTIRKMLA